MAPAPTEEERREKRLKDGIGIPQIIVDCAAEKQPTAVVLQSPRLPSVEEVWSHSQNASLDPNENELICFVHFRFVFASSTVSHRSCTNSGFRNFDALQQDL